jgi:hypothetical protein
MALTKKEITLILRMTRKGANPTLLAQLIDRDPRVVLETLEALDIRGPWPEIPKTTPPPDLRARARAILIERTLPTVEDAVHALQEGQGRLDPGALNLLIKTLVEERERLQVEATA